VFLNRAQQLEEIKHFLEQDKATVLHIVGLPAIGKSTLVRGALELRRKDVPVVWITCEGLTSDAFINEVCVGLGLNLESVVKDPQARIAAKVAVLLRSIVHSSILVLDGLESLLTENGQYLSQDIFQIVNALTTLEHKLKTLITTRTVPTGVGKPLLRLKGVSPVQAVKLFQERAALDPEQVTTLFPDEVWIKLEGHPKFIELLAVAVGEVPVKEILEGLLTATDIGDFILEQVISRTSSEELQILRATLVFRQDFTYESLQFVYHELYDVGAPVTNSIKKLVRRNILEPVGNTQVSGYYLHQMLRDAIPRPKELETRAHSAAAQWFLTHKFDPSNATTYADVLYHLRQASTITPSVKQYLIYRDFILNYGKQLSFAGWGQRLIEDFLTLIKLSHQLEEDKFMLSALLWALGVELWSLHDYDHAIAIFRELIMCWEKIYEQAPEERKESLVETLLLFKAKLGESLATQGRFDEAKAIAEEIGPLANKTQDIQCKLRHRELCFSIARKTRDIQQMSYWGEESIKLAQQWARESPSPQSLDALAEAHFQLGVVNIWKQNNEEVYRHLTSQLKIKLEIGKLQGVGAGLFNLGSITISVSPAEGAAMLLAAEEVKRSVGEIDTDDFSELFAQARQILKEPEAEALGRQLLSKISNDLLPFYESALTRSQTLLKSSR
jgi:tetratricopeptide (TPR) repeat protein